MGTVDWKACAARVSGLVAAADLEPAALAWLGDLPAGRRAGIACSGGADSVLLTLLLVSRFARGPDWHVLHYDHGTRGDASVEDARFVAEMAAGLDLPFHQGKGSFHGRPNEARMRDARMTFLGRALAEVGATTLVLGHQADDVAESMLIRLARGSGATGLAAPRPVQAVADGLTHVRPLLRMRREPIQTVLRKAGAPWRDDASNQEGSHLRNRLRRDVLPAWEEAESRNLVTGVLLARRRLEEEDDALAEWTASHLSGMDLDQPAIDLAGLTGRPRALWRRAIEAWVHRQPGLGGVGRAWLESLLDTVMAGASTRLSAGIGCRVEVEGSRLRFCAQSEQSDEVLWPDRTLAFGSTLVLPGGARVAARAVVLDPATRTRVLAGEVDPEREAWIIRPPGNTVRVRTRAEGDRYQALGSPGSTKVGDQFTNRKIPMERRVRLPVFCFEQGEVIWSPGLPPADPVCINAETIHAVQLTYCWLPATIHL